MTMTQSTDARRDQLPRVATLKPGPIAHLESHFSPIEALVSRRTSPIAESRILGMHNLPVTAESKAQAVERLRRIPDRGILHDQCCMLNDAIKIPASPIEARAICAAMIAAIPSAQARVSETYADALVSELLHPDDGDSELSAFVLYAASRAIRRTARFCPTIAEVLDAARIARNRLTRAITLTERLTEIIMNAEAVVDFLDDSQDVPFAEDDDIPG